MSVVGIDLGTTNTVVACVRAGRVHVIADENGNRLLPSVVSFHPNGEVLVGNEAKSRRGIDGRNTISSVKRLIGRSWHSEELTKARQRFPFEMREGPGQGPLVVARSQEFTLPEISAFILKKARHIGEAALGEPVERAVITVPAHFNELQRASTKVAGRVSGVEVLRILNEPTAAALAYGLGRANNERIAVYDFGGGTFDCTLLDLSGNVFEVLASAGDTFLGGDDVDTLIAERMADALLQQFRYDPRQDPEAFERLRLAAEQVKIDLSINESTQVRLREVAYGVGGAALDLTFAMTRTELEQLSEPLVERSFKVTQDALSLARLTSTSFDHVILVGGSTRMPLVRRRVEQFFGLPPLDRVNPDEVVAIGAAIQAAALSDQLRRRSIPLPPPAARKAATTQRGISELPDERPYPPQSDDPNTMTANVPSIVTAAGANSGAAVTDRMLASAPDPTVPTTAAPSAPPGATGRRDWSDESPQSRTLPLDARQTGQTTPEPNTLSLPSAPSQPNTLVRGPGGAVSSPRPSTAPMPQRMATTAPMTQPMPQAPPKPGFDALDNTAANFPDLRDLPGPQPVRGFKGFGAIEEMPSIQSTTGAAAQAHADSGQPSPLGDTEPPPHQQQPLPPPPQPQAYSTRPQPQYQAPQQQPPQQQPAQQQPPYRPSTQPPQRQPSQPAQAPHQQQPQYRQPTQPPQQQPQYRQSTQPPQQQQPPYARQASVPPPPQYPQQPQQPPYAQQPQYPQQARAPSWQPDGFGNTQLPRYEDAPFAPQMPDNLPPLAGGYSMPPGFGSAAGAPILVDVTPRALVVETVGGYCDTVIPRNAKIPCERTRQFTTGSDYQTIVRVRVAQGEHQTFLHNTYLGEVELSGIRPGIRGEVQIDVTFEIDADGSVRVRATDMVTRQEAVATLQLVGLATDEPSILKMIDRMAHQPVDRPLV